MVRTLIYIGVFFGLVFALPARAGNGAQFFSSILDMPLMPGLRELPDQTVMFDKPEGRIVESVAAVEEGSPVEVARYYDSILPQFGWERIAENAFVRNGERLVLSFETIQDEQFLRVTVTPR